MDRIFFEKIHISHKKCLYPPLFHSSLMHGRPGYITFWGLVLCYLMSLGWYKTLPIFIVQICKNDFGIHVLTHLDIGSIMLGKLFCHKGLFWVKSVFKSLPNFGSQGSGRNREYSKIYSERLYHGEFRLVIKTRVFFYELCVNYSRIFWGTIQWILYFLPIYQWALVN